MRDPITALERAIQSLPAATRAAMLEGIREHPIVCGAYTDGRGGICPMLAAHRHGGRVTMLAFARSWDAFTRTRRVRRASARELRTLEHLLLASLEQLPVGGPPAGRDPRGGGLSRGGRESDFAQAIAEYQASKARSPARDRLDRASPPPGEDIRARRLSASRRSGPPAAAGAAARTAW